MMQTYSLNALAEQFEIDRATMVRALRKAPPDTESTKGRPQWKTATAARALEAHRRSTGSTDSRSRKGTIDTNWQDPELVKLYAEQDAADKAMRKLPSLAARRKAAIAMIPLITRVDQATRERGKTNGHDAEAVDIRADLLYQLQLRGLEQPCSWTTSETWAAMNVEGR